MFKFSHLSVIIFVSGLLSFPLFFVASYILMLSLQALGLKSPDQYLDEVLPIGQVEFFLVIFVLIFLVLSFGFSYFLYKKELSQLKTA